MVDFARPVTELHKEGDSAIPLPHVSPSPSPGQGFSLNEQGRVPIVSEEGQWTMEYVEVSHNFPDVDSQSGGASTVTVPGLKVGDLCFFIGQDGTDQNSRIHTCRPPVCATEGQIIIQTFNADNISNDPDASTLSFLVFHRFIVS